MITFTPVSSSIGAVAEGIRLSDPLDEPARDAIIAALAKHHVVFFRDQTLTPVQHRDLLRLRIAEMLAVSNLCVNTIAHSTTNREKLSITSATSAGQNFRTLLS